MATILSRSFRPSLRRKLFSLADQTTRLRNCAFYSITKSPEPATNEPIPFKAAILHPKKTGLTMETMILPNSPEENMVKVGIEYCALNAFDALAVSKEINSVTLPFIPGSQFSGKILDIGPKCSKGFKIGDKVVVFGDTLNGGGLSQQCFVPETECIRMDTDKMQNDTGTIIQGYANAMLAFSKYIPLEENDDIIIIAGPGGDGMAAIEVATKIFKANVLVIFSSKSVDALVRDDNVEKAINTDVGLTKVHTYLKKTDKTFKAVYDAHDSKLLYVVSDFISPAGQFLTIDPFYTVENFEPPHFRKDTNHVRKRTTKAEKADKKAGKPKPTSEEIEAAENANDWTQRIKRVNILGYQIREPEYYEKIINEVNDLIATEKVEPFISKTYNLNESNKAIHYLNGKKCLGNVLVKLEE